MNLNELSDGDLLYIVAMQEFAIVYNLEAITVLTEIDRNGRIMFLKDCLKLGINFKQHDFDCLLRVVK